MSQTYGIPFGHHVAYALDDPTSFWLWVNTAANKREDFHNVKTSDLSDLAPTPWTRDTFEEGLDRADPSIAPDRFGCSGSCPLIVLPLNIGGVGGASCLNAPPKMGSWLGSYNVNVQKIGLISPDVKA